MNKVFLLLITFFTSVLLHAEVKIVGRVSMSNQPESTIPFASIALYGTNDTTRIAYASISDFKGNFSIPKVHSKTYQVVVSCVGYATSRTTYSVPEGNEQIKLDLSLQETNLNVGEVTVTANRVQTGIDKTSYRVTSIERSKATSSFDLLGNIPSLNIDKLTRTIAAPRGGAVKILINGVNASERELLALRPDDIVKLEHYDFPPARYSSYEAVVNVVTKPMEAGGVVGLDAQHAVTTGFANDVAFFKFNRNRSQFSLLYSLNYRDYKEREVIENYAYRLNVVDYKRDVNSKSNFGYNDHKIDISYSNQLENKYAFQLKFSPNTMVNQSTNLSNVTSYLNAKQIISTGKLETNGTQFNPVFEAYYWHKLPNSQEITLNVVGTGYYSRNQLVNIEQTALFDTTLRDRMKSNNDKSSIIGEVVYARNIMGVKTNFGFRHIQAFSENKVENSFDNPTYKTTNRTNFAYAEVTGKVRNFTYNVSMGLSNNSFTENFNNNRYNPWLFRPFIMIGYSKIETMGFKLYYVSQSIEPDLSQLSNNKVYVAQGIVSQGNPNLKPFRGHVGGLFYYYHTKRINVNLAAQYQYAKNFISVYYFYTQDYIAKSAVTGNYGENLTFNYSGVYKPFEEEWLQFKVNGSIINSHDVSAEIGEFSHLSTPLSGTVEATFYKMLTLNYTNTLVSKNLDGAYLTSTENYSNLGLTYRGGSLSASVNVFWPFSRAKYSSETVGGSIVQYNKSSIIRDNASMVTFGLSYSFQYGSRFKDINRQLKNSDTDSGVFKQVSQ